MAFCGPRARAYAQEAEKKMQQPIIFYKNLKTTINTFHIVNKVNKQKA